MSDLSPALLPMPFLAKGMGFFLFEKIDFSILDKDPCQCYSKDDKDNCQNDIDSCHERRLQYAAWEPTERAAGGEGA